MYAPFEKPKNKELDRLLSEGEAKWRRRWAAKSRLLDWVLISLVVALALIAFTRLAAWLARAF